VAIAVVGNPEEYTYPCGVCRQVIREFSKDVTIIIAKNEDDYKLYKLSDLLPHSFGPEDLDK
ncbi:MAG: cytidine deaminase, partial [Tissierellales bacterium]